MPVKFKLFSRSGRKTLHFQLLGEFDGSVACELINKITENGSRASRIIIDTAKLRRIHPFGETVFQRRLHQSAAKSIGLTFTGKYKHKFDSRHPRQS